MSSYLLEFVTFFFSEACQDVYHDCSIYKPYCKHDTYKDFVSVYCKKTCNLCPKGTDFLNILPLKTFSPT